MARILKLGAKAEDRENASYATRSTEAEQQGRKFEIAEGVSCENCHGPASVGWVRTQRPVGHTRNPCSSEWPKRENVIHRTEKCLECHLGTKDKFVDHEIDRSGHPDLYFELDSFSSVMPRHWKQPLEFEAGKPMEDPAWVGVRNWSAGQAVQLRAALEPSRGAPKVSATTKKDVWPEYGELSCFACHHSLGRPKIVGGRSMNTPAGGRAIRRGMNRACRVSPGGRRSGSRRRTGIGKKSKGRFFEMSKLNPDKSVVIAAAGQRRL